MDMSKQEQIYTKSQVKQKKSEQVKEDQKTQKQAQFNENNNLQNQPHPFNKSTSNQKISYFSSKEQRLRFLLKKFTKSTTKTKDGETYNYRYSQLNQKDFRQLKKIIICNENDINLEQFNELLDLMLTKYYLPNLKQFLIKGCHFDCNLKTVEKNVQKIQQKKEEQKDQNSLKKLNQSTKGNLIILSKHANMKRLDFRKSSMQRIQLCQLLKLEILCLTGCKQLRSIQIKQCKNILKLNLSQTFLNQQTIQQILQSLFNLQQLNLSKSSQIEKLNLKNHKNLNILDISLQSSLSFLCLTKFDSLKLIKMEKCFQLTTVKLIQMQKIMSLNLRKTSVNRIQIKSASSMVKLNLNYRYELKALLLENCENLRKVIVNSTQLQELQLNNLPTLQYINVAQCFRLKNIKILDCNTIKKAILQNTNISDSQLQDVCKNMPNLIHLNLHCCSKLQFNQQLSFNIQRCKNLKVLNLRNTQLNQRKLKSLVDNLSQLQYLNMKDSFRTLKIIQLKNLPKLKELQLDIVQINQIVLENVGLNTIEWRSLRFGKLKKMHIIDCPFVRSIQIDSPQLNDILLQKLPSLRKLCLGILKKNQFDLNSFPLLNQLKLYRLQVKELKLQKLKFIKEIQLQHSQYASIVKYQQNQGFKLLNFRCCNIQKLSFFDLQSNRLFKTDTQQKEKKQWKIRTEEKELELKKKQQKVDQQQKIKENNLLKFEQNSIRQKQINFSFIQGCRNYQKSQNVYSIYDYNPSRLKILAFNTHLTYLKKLDLSNNFIDNIEVLGFICKQQLKQVDLKGNLISNLKALNKLVKLPGALFLQQNKLSKLIKSAASLKTNQKNKNIQIKMLKVLNENMSIQNIMSLLYAKRQMVKKMKIEFLSDQISSFRYSHIMDNGSNKYIHL